MFSGFKSMIFGYYEPANEAEEASVASGAAKLQENTSESSTPGVLLEQTLNAATTKFTEQLLPQQASIEQLQSSSHQLLPTLNEQQELIKDEHEAKNEKNVCDNDATAELDDDDLLADSWELLDLVERKTTDEVTDDLVANDIQIINDVSDDNIHQPENGKLSKSSSGILKSSIKNQANDLQQQQEQQQVRQKPKVSFETPDLVKGKQKIDRFNEPKQGASKNGRSKGSNKTKKNKQASGKAKSTMIGSKREEKLDVVSLPPFPSEPIEMVKKSPPLNYAAAVSKQKKDCVVVGVANESKPEVEMTKPGEETLDNFQPGKAVKRHRHESTSSFYSQGEFQPNEVDLNSSSVANEGDDNESIMSSGFSDCDYEYKGLDDYVMRPKRSISKRGRNKSSILSQNSKRNGNNSTTASSGSDTREGKESVECKSVSVKSTSGTQNDATTRFKTSKSKKQRNADSSSTNFKSSLDFLKPIKPKLVSSPATTSMSGVVENNNMSNDSSDVAEMDESWYVTPPPCFTGANQLVESPEMKLSPKGRGASAVSIENALIEHPSIYIASTSTAFGLPTRSGGPASKPEFTGSGSSTQASKPKPIILKKVKSQQSSAREQVDRKNGSGHFFDADDAMSDLDEFWATAYDKPPATSAGKPRAAKRSSAKQQQAIGVQSDQRARVGTKQTKVGRKSDDEAGAQVKPLVSSGSGSSLSSLHVVGKTDKKAVAWRNKFIVDDWDLDDQEDPTSDFDDMFGPVRKKKAVRRANATSDSQKKQQRRGSTAAPELRSAEGSTEPIPPPMAVNINDSKEIADDVQLIGSEEPVESQATISLELEDIASALEGLKENQRLGVEELSSSELQLPASRRPPTQVQPIGPEKKPGWQLRRQRSKRRSAASSSAGSSPSGGKSQASARDSQQALRSKSSSPASNSRSSSVSARSTPTLIDRIGSTIVANLNQLTSGFAAVNPMLVQAHGCLGSRPTGLILMTGEQQQAVTNGDRQHQGPHGQIQQQELANRASKLAALGESRANQLVGRKQMAKGFLKRQNGVSSNQSSQRRADRRLRMFARPNGCSINRKVQTQY